MQTSLVVDSNQGLCFQNKKGPSLWSFQSDERKYEKNIFQSLKVGESVDEPVQLSLISDDGPLAIGETIPILISPM